jgi:multiple antibiotic resistance protein
LLIIFEDLFMQSDLYSTYLSGALALFIASFTSIISVANPLAAMPVFLSLTERNTET